jgi:hypothetical protein
LRAWTLSECRASTDESRIAGEWAPSEMAIESEKPFLPPSSDEVRSYSSNVMCDAGGSEQTASSVEEG